MIDKRFNLLLIEDSSNDAILLQEELKETSDTHFNVEWVDRMSKGLGRLAEGGIDAVLLDLSLPDSRGVDSFKKVYKQAPDVPIILLTGLDDEKLAVEVLQMGAQDYLVKHNIDGNTLGRSIRYAIERHRLSAALEESEQRFR